MRHTLRSRPTATLNTRSVTSISGRCPISDDQGHLLRDACTPRYPRLPPWVGRSPLSEAPGITDSPRQLAAHFQGYPVPLSRHPAWHAPRLSGGPLCEDDQHWQKGGWPHRRPVP